MSELSPFLARPASRVGVVPIIDLYSESGCGKTFSALLLARGIAGPDGKIVGVDTESRRMSLYADVIKGGFDVIDFDSPFTPARYIEALTAAYALKPAVVVVDSMSHEWEGIGGVCDMAAANEANSNRAGLHNWKTPKFEHQKLVQFLLRSPVPLICCIRAKYKTRQKKGTQAMYDSGEIEQKQIGRTIIIKDQTTSPIQAEDFIFESTAHAEILPNHTIIVTKCSHPELRKCFPKDQDGMITVQHGEAIASWCKNPSGTAAAKTESKLADPLAALKKQLWTMTIPIHGHARQKLEQHLWDENLMADTEALDTLTESRIVEIIDAIKAKAK